MSTNEIGVSFARALADKDFSAIRSLLADDIDFRAMTPGQFWQAATPDEVIEKLLRSWFEESDDIQELISCSTTKVADRNLVTYRFRVRNPDGEFLVEQQMYFDVSGDKIVFGRSICSGFRPLQEEAREGIAPIQ
jgi:hypothetical protein